MQIPFAMKIGLYLVKQNVWLWFDWEICE